ncbi:enoyl-CoA hydratase-related protein [Burkholderia cepacia]|uniref:enoyl-CoA hydratase-related protein n=1 Tax=Burkholderia cepacia TaxID=292 RepID=UPI0012960694|nr:enoyl-CoA hydratase-related protein [Burkholderia cepacia]QFS42109.1 Enoyl-CoA hydratase/isomera [Burkholderia cepacia]
MTTNISSNLEQGVLQLVFSSADGLNTLDDAWCTALAAALRDAAHDPAVRAVLLSAQGRAFCAGANLDGMRRSALQQGFDGSPLAQLTHALAGFTKPLIGAVHGKAIGGGATLLLHCDLVAAAADTQFLLPFTSLGGVPEFASTYLLPRSAGSRLATELLLLAQPFDAETALRAGIVNHVVAAGQELPLAEQWAQRLAALAPNAVQNTRRLLRQTQHAGLVSAIDTEGAALAAALHSPEVREAFSAFLEKRRPNFAQFH